MNYIYFDGAESFPFEPEKTDFLATNAWWLAESAFLAYTHPGFARMAYKLAGRDGFRFVGGKATECMISWDSAGVIVAFRGTEMKSFSTLREIGTDLNTVPVPFGEGGRVHKGFHGALEEIWSGEEGLEVLLADMMKEAPKRPVWFTGHSLGGALASLAFARVPTATGLYVFGSPRVGNREFSDLMQGRPVWRIEHGRDPITQLPPDAPALGLDFVPIGNLVYIDEDGHVGAEKPHFDPQKEGRKAKRTLLGQIAGVVSILRRPKKQVARTSEGGLVARYLSDTRATYAQVDEHIQQSLKEWRDYLDNLDRATVIRLEDHMPIYYAGKLWNHLVDLEEPSS